MMIMLVGGIFCSFIGEIVVIVVIIAVTINTTTTTTTTTTTATTTTTTTTTTTIITTTTTINTISLKIMREKTITMNRTTTENNPTQHSPSHVIRE